MRRRHNPMDLALTVSLLMGYNINLQKNRNTRRIKPKLIGFYKSRNRDICYGRKQK